MDPGAGYATTPAANRMGPHVQAIAIVNYVLAALGLVGVLALLFLFGLASAITGASEAPPWVPGVVASLGFLLVLVPLAYTVLCFLAGRRLAARRQSGKTLAMVTAVISLFAFPLGTLFGIYAIWALMQDETDLLLGP